MLLAEDMLLEGFLSDSTSLSNIINTLFRLLTGVEQVYCAAEMYAGRVACYTLVSHSQYADKPTEQTDRQTNGRWTVTLRFPIDSASVISSINYPFYVQYMQKMFAGLSH